MNIFKTTLLATTLAVSSLPALASDYNRISFSSEVKSEIANDEIRASLSKTAQATTAAAIANDLNKTINHALKIAKNYPEVTVTTGRQNTYPRYNGKDNNKIIGFTGSVSLDLRSNNFEQASQLIADLQSTMVIDHLGFGISEKAQEAETKRLQAKAIERFQAEAKSISQAFGASDYQIINVQLGGSNHYYPRPMAMMSMKAMDASVEAQNFESGKTTVSYNANGVIELVK